MRAWLRLLFATATALLAACDQLYWICEPPDDALLAKAPARLSESGLYADLAHDVIAPDVIAYQPQFELWSDGAQKRRWLWLPEGTSIDTRDMDAWRFPEGTKLWKEFRRAGKRIETRLLAKVGPGERDWVAMAYLWSADQQDAYAVPEGALDTHGTRHDVPAAGECFACHGGTKSRVLGVSAVQLSAGEADEEGELMWLGERGLLSHPPERAFVVPGNATERAALGYLHANCAHCHNQARPEHAGARCYDPNNALDFQLLVDDLERPRDTRTYRSVGDFITVGEPSQSKLIKRVSTRESFDSMPPLGTEQTNEEAVALLRRWVAELKHADVR